MKACPARIQDRLPPALLAIRSAAAEMGLKGNLEKQACTEFTKRAGISQVVDFNYKRNKFRAAMRGRY